MKFMFFTLGGYLFWEDIYNYQDWTIQKHIRTTTYRLLDSHNICREKGTFEHCKETLTQYISAYELDSPHDNSIIIITGFGYSRRKLSKLINKLDGLNANIIIFRHASFRISLTYHANILTQFLKNIDTKGSLSFITAGTGGLILRKMINNSDNFRKYKIKRILEINPLNTGSDLAEILSKNKFFSELIGPMLKDITPKKIMSLAKLPQEIDHGILLFTPRWQAFIKKILARYNSFPSTSKSTEESFAETVYKISPPISIPLKRTKTINLCKRFLTEGYFIPKNENSDTLKTEL